MTGAARDHGGGLDAAIANYGGTRANWIDLSTGINPIPYPVGDIGPAAWTALPDHAAQLRLERAARKVWRVPDDMTILAAPGASALIARLPSLWPKGRVDIPSPTYNEHAAAFTAHGWEIGPQAPYARVLVHPNNPTGQFYGAEDLTSPITVIDESFCDIAPEQSLLSNCHQPGHIVLKSFGKFWGLAGLRLGFVIGHPETLAPLSELLGPWPVSGPALEIGARALEDHNWATETRARLAQDAKRLDTTVGWPLVGGTDLFRTYEVPDAAALQDKLAQNHVWSRIFPYSKTWIRLGLPAPHEWDRLEDTL
ncbi:MAG: threonine-phosphate decarboxylase [Pseudomonadota bacterium]